MGRVDPRVGSVHGTNTAVVSVSGQVTFLNIEISLGELFFAQNFINTDIITTM